MVFFFFFFFFIFDLLLILIQFLVCQEGFGSLGFALAWREYLQFDARSKSPPTVITESIVNKHWVSSEKKIPQFCV